MNATNYDGSKTITTDEGDERTLEIYHGAEDGMWNYRVGSSRMASWVATGVIDTENPWKILDQQFPEFQGADIEPAD